MVATERWQALEEIVSFLVKQGSIKEADQGSVLAALHQREETMSTGIGFGIAIPHASCDSIKKVVVAFGRSEQGIEFESLDEKPVHFVVLFLVPQDQYQTHLKTLSAIAKFLNNRVTREELTVAPDAKAIIKILNRE
ncbi:MAG: PTS sugar transporter subunit IIC [Verrucomicrobia bacterium RIFCSPHIGHO2_12_FULL_41_10]|nr:MAG: PTS sugar transporter subunit IIC [Verrucomicrobia bacterium RIFCSPHIGHO2_12_FULL_41_10]